LGTLIGKRLNREEEDDEDNIVIWYFVLWMCKLRIVHFVIYVLHIVCVCGVLSQFELADRLDLKHLGQIFGDGTRQP